MLVAREGSWNRTKLFGHDVVMVTADPDGKNARVTPFLAGFLDPRRNAFWGRGVPPASETSTAPSGICEQSGAIYRVSHRAAPAAPRPPH